MGTMKRTLAPGFTKQKVLETVKRYNNGTKAQFDPENAQCAYQTREGNRCFIGAFIPDGHEALKCPKNVIYLLEDYPSLADLLPFQSVDDLNDFQVSHDAAQIEFEGDTYAALEDFLTGCKEAK